MSPSLSTIQSRTKQTAILVQGHTYSADIYPAFEQEFDHLDVTAKRSLVEGSSLIEPCGREINRAPLKSTNKHTNSLGICAMLDEEFHNFHVAFSRRIKQSGVTVLIYPRLENKGDRKIGPGTYL
jgi:hypothetical protein